MNAGEDNCNNEEFCQAAAQMSDNGCNYAIKPIKSDSFGAEVSGVTLG